MPTPTNPPKEPDPRDLNDAGWVLLRPLLPGPPKLGRPPRYDRRLVRNAIFHGLRSGCAWPLLPHDLPHGRLVSSSFACWRESGLGPQLNDALRD